MCIAKKKNIRKRFINVLAQTCKDKKKGLSLMYVTFYLSNTNCVKNEPLLYHSGDALYQTLLVKTIFDTALASITLTYFGRFICVLYCTLIYLLLPAK